MEIHLYLAAITAHCSRTTITQCVWFSGWEKFSHKGSTGTAKCCQLASFQWENSVSQTYTYTHRKWYPPPSYYVSPGCWAMASKSPCWDKGLGFLKQPPMAKSPLMGQWLLTVTMGPQLPVSLYVLVCTCEYEYLCACVLLWAHLSIYSQCELTHN